MTVSNTNRRAGPFPGAGSPGPFGFNFYMPAPEYVVAVLADPDGIETTLDYATDYTVALNEDQSEHPGGNVTLADDLAEGYTLTLTSNVPSLQPTDITNLSGFYQKLITVALDRLTVLVQQLEERVGRAFVAPISGGADIAELLAQLAAQLQYVQAVYARLDAVQTVAADIDDVQAIVEHIDPIRAIAADMAGSWTTGVVYDFGSITEPAAGGTTDAVGNIVTVAGHIENVDTVAENIADVSTVSLYISAVQTVVADSAAINTIVADQENIDAVANNTANINAVAGNESNINAAVANEENINAAVANEENINAVVANETNINTVAAAEGAVNTVAASDAEVHTVADNVADVNTVAGIAADVQTVAANVAAIIAALSGALTPANNLSDVADVAEARANLGLADLGSIA
ncbi:hypothetical protein G3T20_05310 [Bordetella hinzii]|uniref:hypothetical protein n=1 Tax=Bordetella hinzii TaxID=103855 RepID=UPI0013EFDE33|nr:hypothetical protein [Bordetella hinzii]QII84170.1 hypothetical protein G3T20_05310 [Bordetella hinzii]